MLAGVAWWTSSDTCLRNPQLLGSPPVGDLERNTERLRNLQKIAQREDLNCTVQCLSDLALQTPRYMEVR